MRNKIEFEMELLLRELEEQNYAGVLIIRLRILLYIRNFYRYLLFVINYLQVRGWTARFIDGSTGELGLKLHTYICMHTVTGTTETYIGEIYSMTSMGRI